MRNTNMRQADSACGDSNAAQQQQQQKQARCMGSARLSVPKDDIRQSSMVGYRPRFPIRLLGSIDHSSPRRAQPCQAGKAREEDRAHRCTQVNARSWTSLQLTIACTEDSLGPVQVHLCRWARAEALPWPISYGGNTTQAAPCRPGKVLSVLLEEGRTALLLRTLPITAALTPACWYWAAMSWASEAFTSSTRPSSSANRVACAPYAASSGLAGRARSADRPQLPAGVRGQGDHGARSPEASKVTRGEAKGREHAAR